MADGDNFILGQANAASSETTLAAAVALKATLSVTNDGQGDGVKGTATGTLAQGVYGISDHGNGVRGDSFDIVGVLGISNHGFGVQGVSFGNKAALRGEATAGPGVWASSNDAEGVTASGRVGVNGFGNGTAQQQGHGVHGHSVFANGVQGNSDNAQGVSGEGNIGVFGQGNNSGVVAFNIFNNNQAYLASRCCAAYFVGIVHVVGNFSVEGTKSAVVRHPDGSHRQLYCMESPESWFEDFGIGQLHEGEADVRLDHDFAALVHTDSYHVFLTPYGDSNGLFVAHMRPNGFVVHEQQGGKHSLAFAYRVVAKRRDVDVVRLQPFEMPVPPVAPERPPQPLHHQP